MDHRPVYCPQQPQAARQRPHFTLLGQLDNPYMGLHWKQRPNGKSAPPLSHDAHKANAFANEQEQHNIQSLLENLPVLVNIPTTSPNTLVPHMPLYDALFFALHLPIIPAWGLLLLAPHHPLTARYVHSMALPILLGTLYSALLFAGICFGQSNPDAGMNTLPAVMALFSHPLGTLTGWAHFLVFDIFVGAWIARDARSLGYSHLTTLPALFLSLMFGPIGLLIHALRRSFNGHGRLNF